MHEQKVHTQLMYIKTFFQFPSHRLKSSHLQDRFVPLQKKAKLPNNISCCIVYNLCITDMHVMNMCILVLQLCCQMHYFSICYLHIVLFEKSVAQKKFIHGFCTLFIPSRNNYLYLNCRNHKSTPFEYFSYKTQFLLGQ